MGPRRVHGHERFVRTVARRHQRRPRRHVFHVVLEKRPPRVHTAVPDKHADTVHGRNNLDVSKRYLDGRLLDGLYTICRNT